MQQAAHDILMALGGFIEVPRIVFYGLLFVYILRPLYELLGDKEK